MGVREGDSHLREGWALQRPPATWGQLGARRGEGGSGRTRPHTHATITHSVNNRGTGPFPPPPGSSPGDLHPPERPRCLAQGSWPLPRTHGAFKEQVLGLALRRVEPAPGPRGPAAHRGHQGQAGERDGSALTLTTAKRARPVIRLPGHATPDSRALPRLGVHPAPRMCREKAQMLHK